MKPIENKNACVNIKGHLNSTFSDLCEDNHILMNSQFGDDEPYLSMHQDSLRLTIPSLSIHPIPQLNEKHYQITKKSIAGKALGKKTKLVLDATAGLGGDSIMFAKMGFNVISMERQAYTFLLLNDNIMRSGLSNQIQTIYNDSQQYLLTLSDQIDAVFFDPMYPEKDKKALPNIRMRALAQLSQNKDDDFLPVFSSALSSTVERIVVKRPDHSPVLEPNRLVHSYKGKSVRYDAYHSHG